MDANIAIGAMIVLLIGVAIFRSVKNDRKDPVVPDPVVPEPVVPETVVPEPTPAITLTDVNLIEPSDSRKRVLVGRMTMEGEEHFDVDHREWKYTTVKVSDGCRIELEGGSKSTSDFVELKFSRPSVHHAGDAVVDVECKVVLKNGEHIMVNNTMLFRFETPISTFPLPTWPPINQIP